MIQVARKGLAVSATLALCLAAAACSSSASSSSSSSSTSGSSSSAGTVPSISITQLDRTFNPMAATGKGNVAVILPDTVSSARYTEFDAPSLSQALATAGLTPSQYSVVNAQRSDATELSDAQEAITKGASVLIM